MPFTLYPYQHPPLSLPMVEGEHDEHLYLRLQPAQLRQAEVNQWFFMQEELKGPMSDGAFMLALPMIMELAVRPDLSYRHGALLREWGDTDAMLKALAWEAQQPGSAEPDILLRPDSWLCLGVAQPQPGGHTGYRTLWDRVLDHMAARGIGPKDLDFRHMLVHLDPDADDQTDLDIQIGDGQSEVFATWPVRDNPRLTPSVPLDLDSPQRSVGQDLLGATCRLLDGRNVSYSLLGQNGLQFAHVGQHGRWRCEAKVWPEQAAVAFYSLHPLPIPAERRSAVEAWTIRRNHDCLIGTFAYDSAHRDLRLRTSATFADYTALDQRLTQLWQQNVQTFDQHYAEMTTLIMAP